MQIEPINAFSDNYIWLLHDNNKAWVVDPGDAAVVIDTLTEKNLSLEGIMVTHHHFDHTGGIEALINQYDPLIIPGPSRSAIAGITQKMTETDRITILGTDFDVMDVPGHTLDHIAFYAQESSVGPILFCGDTLFAGGCGRIFEGTPPMMNESLGKLASLPVDTKVYCAHEYTMANLAFASAVEPNNIQLAQRVSACQALRDQGIPTVPSTIGDEQLTNPFLRSGQPEVINAAIGRNSTCDNSIDAVFTEIREWKNNF